MRFLILFLFATIGLSVNAQQISGTAKDADGKPLAGATISLLKDTGSTVLKFTATKDNGNYNFDDVKPGKYRVSATNVGFQPFVSVPFSVNNSSVTVPEIKLTKASATMNNVVVTARKPIV